MEGSGKGKKETKGKEKKGNQECVKKKTFDIRSAYWREMEGLGMAKRRLKDRKRKEKKLGMRKNKKEKEERNII